MKIIETKVKFNSKLPIIDNEISNDISNPKGDWFYEKGEIICCSVLFGDKVRTICMEKTDNKEDFKKELIKLLSPFYKMYAFNLHMEKGNFKGFLGKDYEIAEIKPFKGKGFSKEKFYSILVEDNKIDISTVPKDDLENDSKECIERYAKEDYDSIIQHNIADVIKQFYILVNKNYILNKYKDQIKDGWFE